MSESDLFLSDSGDDEEYDVFKDYGMKKRKENISSSEDKAFTAMGVGIKKKPKV